MLFLQVGLVIGKGGETIKYLQQQSGAKIQVARDADSDPRLSTREVEIMGSAEQISHAEQLLKDVIAEVRVQPVLYSLSLLYAQPLLCFTMGDFVLGTGMLLCLVLTIISIMQCSPVHSRLHLEDQVLLVVVDMGLLQGNKFKLKFQTTRCGQNPE
jgi:hypothetical protein